MVANCQIKDATIGQRQPGSGAEIGKPEGFAVVMGCDRDAGRARAGRAADVAPTSPSGRVSRVGVIG